MSEYAGLHILRSPYHIDNTFDYFIPQDLRDDIRVGDFVTVPFGNGNKGEIALVISLKDFPERSELSCKPIISKCESIFSLSEEMQKLCIFMKEQTLCTMGEAVKCIIPSSVFTKATEYFKLTEKTLPNPKKVLDAPTAFIYDFMLSRDEVEMSLLESKFGPAAKPAVKTLISFGLIERGLKIKESKKKVEAILSLGVSKQEAKLISEGKSDSIILRSVTQRGALLHFLQLGIDEITEKELMECCDISYAQIRSLCDKGALKKTLREIDRGLLAISPTVHQTGTQKKELLLNDEQSAAYNTLCELASSKEAKAALLFGVTGSGKTSVMLKTIDRVLENKKSVIILVPEISLTPQTLDIFCSRYGERVAIIHSALSDGERLDTYRRIKSGGVDVVIGTRSAVFAPLDNLGLIIIDEEQEHTYKSDQNPKYHARDIARFRCAHNKALLLLASATPSFESFYKAEQGSYTLIRLKNRYGNARLPKVSVVDMRAKENKSIASPLSNTLCEKLFATKENGNQSILFINRRGYNSFVSCRSCGQAVFCPTCSVSMTFHTLKKSFEQGELRCHWCGRRAPMPSACPECGSPHLTKMGFGTQRIEQELSDMLPDAKLLRMDADTTTSKNSYSEMLNTFRRGEADILLGTQMVTKGHDFPSVTLVGVLSADTSLYIDDYRASEQTFAMLTQVIGRAGRADKEGEAVIQTSNPDSDCIRLACRQDYESFYADEIKLRRALRFPPFCDIALITLSSKNEKDVLRASNILAKKLSELIKKEYNDIPLVTYGPFEASVYKVDSKYRMRMVIKCKLNKRSRSMFSTLLKDFSKAEGRSISISVDFNPSTL